jgi:integrase
MTEEIKSVRPARRLQRTARPGIFRDAWSKDGQTLVIVYRDRRGQRKEFMRGPWRTSMKAALARQREIHGGVVTGEHRPRSRETFESFAREMLPTYKGRTGNGIRPQTIREYERDLELYAYTRIGRIRLTDIEPRDLRGIVTQMENRGLKPNTVRNAMAAVRVVLAQAHEDGLMRYNPAAGLRLAGARRGKVKWLEPDQLSLLMEKIPPTWHLFFHLLVYSGLRISEFLALTWADIHLDQRTLSVNKRVYHGKIDAPKSAYGVRTIPLTRDLVHRLKAHKLASSYSAEGDLVFPSTDGTHLQPSNVARRVFKPAAIAAGVPWASFHTLRHTCGTLLARNGRPTHEIREWLGHHSASFTQDTYIGRQAALPDPDALGLDPVSVLSSP